MATEKEVGRKCQILGYYEKAKTSLCGFSNGQIFIDGDLNVLKKQAEDERLLFYHFKGEFKKLKDNK